MMERKIENCQFIAGGNVLTGITLSFIRFDMSS